MEKTRRFVLEPDAIRVLEQYNIPYPEHGLATSPEEAARIAGELGYPVVLKVVSPDVVHKSCAGGVVVGIGNDREVRAAYERIWDGVQAAVPKVRIEGVLVCKQAPDGLEVIVGGLDDASFGPTVMFGLGGVFAEALKDVSFRIAPLERRDAEEMVAEIKGYSLLTGARGQASYDVYAVVELLLSVSRLMTDHREITEVDLNPVRLYHKGSLVLDARVMERQGR
jgi:acyl-CoA synthetase (NDP forming)